MVKIKKRSIEMGEEIETTHYLPEGVLITKQRKEQADRLDGELKKIVFNINEEYNELEESIKKDEFKKWKWLGTKLNQILLSSKNIEKPDIEKHVIWPAIAQYFREELKRGFYAKRSGENKDHYRKCWLLATTNDIDWIDSWGGWDAYIDRSDQLVLNDKLMPALKKKFKDVVSQLKTKDHQKIAKIITEELPSGTSMRSNINSMSDKDVQKVVDKVYTEFSKWSK